MFMQLYMYVDMHMFTLVPMCVCLYVYARVCWYMCIHAYTCNHLHLELLQILENHFVSFHLAQKLLQYYHTYSNINTLILIHTVML